MTLPRITLSAADLEIGRLLQDVETRLWLESLTAATACIEDLGAALQQIADAGKPLTSAIARGALRAYAEP